MSLLLIETAPAQAGRDEIRSLIDRVGEVTGQQGGEFIEAQVTVGDAQAFIVVEHNDSAALKAALADAGIAIASIDPVRLVGAELSEVKAAQTSPGEYLVEWDLPEGLTMDAYLTRKGEKAPLYDDVPEAKFLRTYVREDMVKCLCFYDGDDEGAVLKARDAVSAPVDRFHRLER